MKFTSNKWTWKVPIFVQRTGRDTGVQGVDRAMRSIDLNCDMGELPEAIADGTQEALMPSLTSVNIACGGHAGDEATMKHHRTGASLEDGHWRASRLSRSRKFRTARIGHAVGNHR